MQVTHFQWDVHLILPSSMLRLVFSSHFMTRGRRQRRNTRISAERIQLSVSLLLCLFLGGGRAFYPLLNNVVSGTTMGLIAKVSGTLF